MIDGYELKSWPDFLEWWHKQSQEKLISLEEAAEIYFNQDVYDIGAI